LNQVESFVHCFPGVSIPKLSLRGVEARCRRLGSQMSAALELERAYAISPCFIA
jgi:hypothetical protein